MKEEGDFEEVGEPSAGKPGETDPFEDFMQDINSLVEKQQPAEQVAHSRQT